MGVTWWNNFVSSTCLKIRDIPLHSRPTSGWEVLISKLVDGSGWIRTHLTFVSLSVESFSSFSMVKYGLGSHRKTCIYSSHRYHCAWGTMKSLLKWKCAVLYKINKLNTNNAMKTFIGSCSRNKDMKWIFAFLLI